LFTVWQSILYQRRFAAGNGGASMTQEQLDAIRARCVAATPGPWVTEESGDYVWWHDGTEYVTKIADIRGWGYFTQTCKMTDDEAVAAQTANAEFIARARQDIPALLYALKEAEENEDFNGKYQEQQRETLELCREELWEIRSDRDRWKARAEALERVIKSKLTACSTCTKKPPKGYCADLYDCINENWSYPHWQFDLERFSGDAP
jgi:hypothetical protein